MKNILKKFENQKAQSFLTCDLRLSSRKYLVSVSARWDFFPPVGRRKMYKSFPWAGMDSI